MIYAAYLKQYAGGGYRYDDVFEKDAGTVEEFLSDIAGRATNEPAPEIAPLVDSLGNGQVFRVIDSNTARGQEVSYLAVWDGPPNGGPDASLRPAVFAIELLGDLTFAGWTDGRDWNGWACPYFPFDEAQKLAVAWRDAGWESSYDAGEDAFHFAAADGQDEEPEVFFGVEMEGKKLYPIGVGAWIWDISE